MYKYECYIIILYIVTLYAFYYLCFAIVYVLLSYLYCYDIGMLLKQHAITLLH